MRRQWLGVLAVVALLGAGTLAALRFGPEPIAVGREAPDFTAVNLATGRPASLHADYAGQVTLVNVWATWCEPCKAEIPALDSLHRRLAPRGFRLVAVSVDTGDSTAVAAFMRGYGVAFDVLHDPAQTIQRIYQSDKVPESFLIDRDGRIVRIVYGAHPWASAANQRIIEALLAQPAPKEAS